MRQQFPQRRHQRLTLDAEADDRRLELGEFPDALPAAVPVELRRIIERCLAKDPDARFATAAALRDAYPETLDDIAAASIVGALTGAISAAAVASLQQGESAEQTRAAMHRAAEIALQYAESLDTAATSPHSAVPDSPRSKRRSTS